MFLKRKKIIKKVKVKKEKNKHMKMNQLKVKKIKRLLKMTITLAEKKNLKK